MTGFFGIFLVFVIIMIFAVVLGIRQSQKADETWRRVGQRLSLRPQGGGMFKRRSLRGMFQGFHVRVFTFSRRTGKSSTTYTAYEVSYPSLRLGLRLKKQGFLSGVARLFGAQDHLIGHPAFDDQVVIKGHRVDLLRRFLTPERRARLLGAFHRFSGLVVTDTGLRVDIRGLETDPDKLQWRLANLTDLARALCTPEETTLGPALVARREGRLDEALEQVRRARPDDLDARVVEGEILLASGRPDEAAKVLDAVREQAPDDAEAAGLAREAWRLVETPPLVEGSAPLPAPPLVEEPLDEVSVDELAEAPPPVEEPPEELPEPPEEEPPEEPAPEPEPPPPLPPGVDVEEVAEALFSSSMTSYESTRLFEETFAGRRVRWSGELQRVETFRYDSVFEDGPGTRALVHVLEIGFDGYGGREVRAVVQLPPEDEEPLRARRGETVAFEGVLVRCDAFMRNLFVARGRLRNG